MSDVRRATAEDAEAIGGLLHDFNTEFGEPTPGPDRLAERMRELIEGDDTVVLLADEGLAVLRLRRSIWTEGLECYLAEVYVAPPRRGRGLGRELLEATIETARAEGADYIDLNTEEEDVAARALYQKLGFENTAYYYEREL